MKTKGEFVLRSVIHADCFCLCLAAALGVQFTPLLARPPLEEPQTSSSPITITKGDPQVWVVNPDNDSVSVIDIRNDANQKIAEIPVGDEPRFLAHTGKGSERKVFVSNSRSGTVSIIGVIKKRPYFDAIKHSADDLPISTLF